MTIISQTVYSWPVCLFFNLLPTVNILIHHHPYHLKHLFFRQPACNLNRNYDKLKFPYPRHIGDDMGLQQPHT